MTSASSTPAVQRQISLPLNKAIEIVWKNIRVRLGRSLLVSSGIVLATAFLMSILAGQAITEGVRDWARAHTASASNGDHVQTVIAQQLSAKLSETGADSADSRTQTRWLVALALLVAFIGILNAMLMSVTERFREIGTMKCLGALDSFIIKLFLLESLIQGIVGTTLGVIFGLGFTLVLMMHTYGSVSMHLARWREIGAGAGFTLVIGIALTVAGAVYPARQAARMQPIEAMRAET